MFVVGLNNFKFSVRGNPYPIVIVITTQTPNPYINAKPPRLPRRKRYAQSSLCAKSSLCAQSSFCEIQFMCTVM